LQMLLFGAAIGLLVGLFVLLILVIKRKFKS